jgi:putative glutamate/gamma-aminobutyrate antiporter
MENKTSKQKKSLSVFSLVMINVIAIDSLRTLPMSAEYGFALVFYYLVAAIAFFLPVALVSAELATAWPENGGVYIWAREAFGKRIGFITIWMQWFYNICWYPTIMSFIAAIIAYTIDPNLINNKVYMLTIVFTFYWLATAINFFGMVASSLLSTVAALIGTIIPMLFIIILGTIWLIQGKPLAIQFNWHSFLPDLSNANNLVLLTAMLYSLVGIEMSAVHAREVKNPQRDYPKAILWSALLILASLILSALAIAIVIPQHQLNIVSGLLQAFSCFFTAFHMTWIMPILAVLIILGSVGGASAWILGPSKGLLAACRDGCLPGVLSGTNRYGVPVNILFAQGLFFTLLCSVFLLLPSVSSSFWALTDVASILSLLVYVSMFLAVLRLRYTQPNVPRSFTIPGGKIGLWVVCLSGLISSLFTIGIGFLPPSQIPVGNVMTYELIICLGTLAGLGLPIIIYQLNQRKNLLNERVLNYQV